MSATSSEPAPGEGGQVAHRRKKSPLRKIAGLIATRLVVATAGFFASALWAHSFSKETYGRYQILTAALSVVASFCLTGLDDATLISSARRKDGNLRVIRRLRMTASTIGAIGIAAWGVLRYWEDDPDLALTFVIAASLFVPLQLNSIWQQFTNGKGKLRALTIGQILLASGNLVAVAAFVVIDATSSSVLPWIVLTSQAMTAAIGIALQFTLQQETTDTDPEIIKYGHHVTFASLIAWALNADRLIVGEVMTASDVAVLSIAIVLPAQVKIFFNAFEQVFLPGVTKAASVAVAWDYMRSRMVPFAAFYIALGILGALLLPVVIPIAFSDRYVAAVPYARWLWLSTCLSAPFAFLATILNSQQDRRFLYTRRLTSQVGLLVLFLVLIPLFGLVGAVIARILNHVSVMVLNSLYFRRVLQRARASAASG